MKELVQPKYVKKYFNSRIKYISDNQQFKGQYIGHDEFKNSKVVIAFVKNTGNFALTWGFDLTNDSFQSYIASDTDIPSITFYNRNRGTCLLSKSSNWYVLGFLCIM